MTPISSSTHERLQRFLEIAVDQIVERLQVSGSAESRLPREILSADASLVRVEIGRADGAHLARLDQPPKGFQAFHPAACRDRRDAL